MKTLFAAVALAIAIPAAAHAQAVPATPADPHAQHAQHGGDHAAHKAAAGADHKAHHDACRKAGKTEAECEKMCAEHGMKHDGKAGDAKAANPHAGHDMGQHHAQPQAQPSR